MVTGQPLSGGPVTFGRLQDRPAAFLARHGYGHTLAPHEINYRANIWALKELKATRIVSVSAVGGIRADLGPGTIVVPSQMDTTADQKLRLPSGVSRWRSALCADTALAVGSGVVVGLIVDTFG